MNRVYLVLFLVASALFSGCAFNAGYNPEYLPKEPLRLGIAGKGLVVMSEADAQWTFSGNPTTFTGGGTTLTIPLGEITKQVALKVFGSAFVDGAAYSTDAANAAEYRLVVKPKIAQFSYAYKQLKNLGFAITPTIDLQLNVVLVNPDGAIVLEKTYAPGPTEGASYMLSGQPSEKINQLLHQHLFKLMTDAAQDAKTALPQ